MSISSVKYIVSIVDLWHDVFVLENARVGELGMGDILQKFTNLDRAARDYFVTNLKANGTWSLDTTLPSGTFYRIQADKFIAGPTRDEAIEELTEAIRFTAEYLSREALPAIEGWSWYDALFKYAPEKASKFLDNHVPPVVKKDEMSESEYEVDIFDKTSQTMIVQNSTVNREALRSILEHIMGLGGVSRNLAFDELDKNSHIKLYARPLDALPFDIWIRRIGRREPIDWDKLVSDWESHWSIRMTYVDLNKHFDEFWNARGGRIRYFALDEAGTEHPRVYLADAKTDV